MQASNTLDCQNVDEDLRFLDENGYLVVKSVISQEEIDKVKSRVAEVRKHQGARWGEFGTSLLREKFIKNNSTIKLKLYDFLFVAVRSVLRLVIKLVPQVRQAMSLYTRVPMDYKHTSTLQREIRQMMLCIVEQMDDPKDRRVCDLVNCGEVFDQFYQNEKILALVKYLIGDDFKLSSMNLRDPQKGIKNQDMHSDYPWAVRGEKYYACNALWLLDDMTEESGATRVICGSHKWGGLPYQGMANVKDNHPDEILVEAKAGDVLFVNSHVWHGGTAKHSDSKRAIIQSFFVHRAHVPQQFHRFQLTSETAERMTEASLDILDIPNFKKAEKVNLKSVS
ncbi:phytanoyl-CoA dioxygenase family protein [Halioxenophilus aromaticivorans]|uniref:Phytanoyl-CoA dioxygenase n=1 Tax=Halioxenophilus aromaticivorans TaxID=1306992 RepID=A0AAV3U7E6_9ALTE